MKSLSSAALSSVGLLVINFLEAEQQEEDWCGFGQRKLFMYHFTFKEVNKTRVQNRVRSTFDSCKVP